MLSTTLDLKVSRSNTGKSVVFAEIGDSTHYIGESDSLGRKRAIMDVLRAGNGSAIAKNIARLEVKAGHRS